MSIDERLELIRKAREMIEVYRDYIEAELLQAAECVTCLAERKHTQNAMDAALKLRALRERIVDGAE